MQLPEYAPDQNKLKKDLAKLSAADERGLSQKSRTKHGALDGITCLAGTVSHRYGLPYVRMKLLGPPPCTA